MAEIKTTSLTGGFDLSVHFMMFGAASAAGAARSAFPPDAEDAPRRALSGTSRARIEAMSGYTLDRPGEIIDVF